jgi:transposase
LPKWFLVISLVFNSQENISARQLAKKIEVNKNTAHYMIARLRKAMKDEPELVQKIAEAEIVGLGTPHTPH